MQLYVAQIVTGFNNYLYNYILPEFLKPEWDHI